VSADDRTPEQHMADVAAGTLRPLGKLQPELGKLSEQLRVLAELARVNRTAAPRERLRDATDAIWTLRQELPEFVRDLAVGLPFYDIEERW